MSDRPSTSATSITLRQASCLLGLLILALVLSGLGDASLRYERTAVFEGEYWRLLTAHFVHANSAHLILNVAGIALIAALFPRSYSLQQWLLILAGSIVVIDAGFVLLEPQLEWYVGFSGVLHGALAAGAIAWWRHESRSFSLALSVILVAKLAWEQWQGALPFSGDMQVIVDAHLYGAVGGALVAGTLWLRDQG